MIDLAHESVLSLTDAVEHLPQRRGGRSVHVATLYRWAQRGVRGVKLEALQVGGTKCTSIEALQRFFERLTALDSGDQPTSRTLKARDKASETANAELAATGW